MFLSTARRTTTTAATAFTAAAARTTTLRSHLSNSTSATMSWHANFPAPKAVVPEMTAAELAAITGTPGVDYIVVDSRRTDIDEEGAPRTLHPAALNLPAQTFYPTLPIAGRLLERIPVVVFHCNSCKPGGRGPRSAAWYQDYLDAKGEKGSKAYILKGGYKGWIAEFPDKVVKL